MSRSRNKREKDKKRQKEHKLMRQQQFIVKQYVFSTSYKDNVMKEIVETAEVEDVNCFLKKSLTVGESQVYFPCNYGWQDGLVLVASLEFNIYQHMLELPSGRKVSVPAMVIGVFQ